MTPARHAATRACKGPPAEDPAPLTRRQLDAPVLTPDGVTLSSRLPVMTAIEVIPPSTGAPSGTVWAALGHSGPLAPLRTSPQLWGLVRDCRQKGGSPGTPGGVSVFSRHKAEGRPPAAFHIRSGVPSRHHALTVVIVIWPRRSGTRNSAHFLVCVSAPRRPTADTSQTATLAFPRRSRSRAALSLSAPFL